MKTRFLQCTIALFVLNAMLHAQVVGDYRSTGSTSLTVTTNWEYYNGTSWGAATIVPNWREARKTGDFLGLE